jgi:hypothetical protein
MGLSHVQGLHATPFWGSMGHGHRNRAHLGLIPGHLAARALPGRGGCVAELDLGQLEQATGIADRRVGGSLKGGTVIGAGDEGCR